MQDKITIGLVEDQELVREGFKSILSNWQGIEVIFEAADGFSVIKKLKALEELPDLLLIDLQLPNYGDRIYSGAHLTVDLKEHFPSIPVIILTVQDDPITMSNLIEKGAQGFLSKSCSPQELMHAIDGVMRAGVYINSQTLSALQNRLKKGNTGPIVPSDELTHRELEVLRLICQELTAKEIGERLYISPKTVNGHRNNLLQKTGARNIAGLVVYAFRKGIVKLY